MGKARAGQQDFERDWGGLDYRSNNAVKRFTPPQGSPHPPPLRCEGAQNDASLNGGCVSTSVNFEHAKEKSRQQAFVAQPAEHMFKEFSLRFCFCAGSGRSETRRYTFRFLAWFQKENHI